MALVLLLTFALLALAACGPTGATQATSAPAAQATAEPTVGATAAATAAPTSAATTEATAMPAAEATAAPGAEATAAPAAQLRTPQEAALAAAGGQQIGGTVTVLGTWGGSEQDSFRAMVAPFEEATGVDVQYEGTRDLNAVLTTRVAGGNPPDVAGLPGPGQMAEFADQGKLVDLGTVLDTNQYQAEYAQSWIDLGTVDGKQVGIFIKTAAKGLIWYNPQVWQQNNFQQPANWDQMTQLAQQMPANGTTPWCIGLESGAASGWPGTDWIEDIVLRQAGAEKYDQWYQGDLAWTSPEIKQAWQTWGQIVGDPQMVYGGANTMLTTNFGNAGDPLFANPPGCYMHHQASFITDFFTQNNPNVEPVTDFAFFPFPQIGESQGQSVIAAGDLFGMFNDTPQSRALIKYLITPEAQAIWVSRGGAISPNRSVPLDQYPDDLSREAAGLLTSAETIRFDASDLMPEAMNNAFWRGILNYVQAPDDLDSVLEELESTRQSAYTE
jgi:alpha-glucoside transport system substrate-binding protein